MKEYIPDRTVIDVWDWHYRVAFDASLSRRIRQQALRLGDCVEYRVLRQTIDAFSSLVSLAALGDAIKESPDRAEEFLSGVDVRCLLHIPRRLEPVIRTQVGHLPPEVTPAVRRQLDALVSSAVNNPFENHHVHLFEPVFGDGLQRLVSRCAHETPFIFRDRHIDRKDLKETVEQTLASLLTREHVLSVMGDVPVPAFDLILKEEPGFAEYWPASLTKNPRDHLIVFDNPEQLRAGLLRTTLSHEVLGHGVLYGWETRHAPPFFDHGATSFIEGWATWFEWHGSASPFGSVARGERLTWLRWFYEPDAGRLCQGMEKDLCALGYSKETISSSLLRFFQYPGFSASYVLGSLWFEDRFQQVSPMEFLGSISTKPWGDFFLAW